MKRRTFIKGAVSAAVAASISGGDGIELMSISHPMRECSFCHGLNGDHFTWCNDVNPLKYTHKTFRVGHDWTFNGKPVTTMVPEGHEFTERMKAALEKSMMQTRKAVAANVFNRTFGA